MRRAPTCTVHLRPLPGHVRHRRGSWRKLAERLAGAPGRDARLTPVQPGRGGSRGMAGAIPGRTS